MKLSKLLKIVFGLLALLAVAVGLTSINHPIILKWVTGAARHHGKPMPATVYINGQVDNHIKVFYTDEPDSYLVSLTAHNPTGKAQIINIDLAEKWISVPSKA